MNAHSNETRLGRYALAISIWENEGGAGAPEIMEHQYGRKIKADRSPTVYHLLTGVSEQISGNAMTGLSRSQASHRMLSLDDRNARRGKGPITLPSSSARPTEAARQP